MGVMVQNKVALFMDRGVYFIVLHTKSTTDSKHNHTLKPYIYGVHTVYNVELYMWNFLHLGLESNMQSFIHVKTNM